MMGPSHGMILHSQHRFLFFFVFFRIYFALLVLFICCIADTTIDAHPLKDLRKIEPGVDAIEVSEENEVELHEEPHPINNARIQKALHEMKSFKSAFGDIIDCVPVEKQPAFDHPLLKDHKIQLEPAAGRRPRRMDKQTNGTSNEGEHKKGFDHGHCEEGTIPIRRMPTTAEASSLHEFGRKTTSHLHASYSSSFSTHNTHDHAIAYVSQGEYYGSSATINVWDPWVEDPTEFSLSQIWILSGSFDGDLNTIEAGWQVSPELYGDNCPRFFIYWTADAYRRTGCYNLLCAGFIQISSSIALGDVITPWSSFQSPQYDIKILIWKDQETGDWWLELGDNILVGYWPSQLFTHLANKATTIEWGGEVTQTRIQRHTGTQMGSGRFPGDGFGHASYFRNVEVVNTENQLQSVTSLLTSVDQPNCYDIRTFYNLDWGNYFYYGGPGRNPSCP